MDTTCAQNLVHYAVDKASPFALDEHEETNTYDKIKAFELLDLAVTTEGMGMMWGWINAYIHKCGGKPVSAAGAKGVVTVEDVYKAVEKAAQ